MNQLAPLSSQSLPVPALVAAAGDQARIRFLEFFAANIRHAHTRRAYSRAVGEFLDWCADAGVPSIAHVAPLHVATWIEAQMRVVSGPSVKQRLRALRHLFDWLVVGLRSWASRARLSTASSIPRGSYAATARSCSNSRVRASVYEGARNQQSSLIHAESAGG